MFAATGPGTENWEPKFPSFSYGFLMPRGGSRTSKEPKFVVEVDDIDDLLGKVEGLGGKILRDRFERDGHQYAVLEDGEGNPFYVWQTPQDVTFDEPESQNYYHWDRTPQ